MALLKTGEDHAQLLVRTAKHQLGGDLECGEARGARAPWRAGLEKVHVVPGRVDVPIALHHGVDAAEPELPPLARDLRRHADRPCEQSKRRKYCVAEPSVHRGLTLVACASNSRFHLQRSSSDCPLHSMAGTLEVHRIGFHPSWTGLPLGAKDGQTSMAVAPISAPSSIVPFQSENSPVDVPFEPGTPGAPV